MPVAVLERDETGTTDSGNWLDTGGASLGEQLAEALGTVRLLVAAREALAGQRHLAVGAREALTVPRFVLVGHAAARDDLLALDATGRVLLLVAAGAVDFLLARDERLGANGRFADAAAEALLVPLSGLVLHLLGSGAEDLAAAVASGRELGIVAIAAVDLVGLRAELLVDERYAALVAQEARLVPVLVFVGQILGVDADRLVALLAHVREHVLVALDAVGMLIAQHVPLAGQTFVALPTAKVARVPILRHGLGVLAALVLDGVGLAAQGLVVGLLHLGDGDLAGRVRRFSALGRGLLHLARLLDLHGLGAHHINVGHFQSFLIN